MKRTRLAVITNEDTTRAKSLLKSFGISATTRKGRGSCRCVLTVTPKNAQDQSKIVEILSSAFSLAYKAPAWNQSKIEFNKVVR